MPLDPSIPLQVQPLKLESPMNQLAMANEVMKMGEMNRSIGEQNQLNEYLRSGADLSSAEGKRGLLNYGKTGIAHAKAVSDIEKSGLETKKLGFEIDEKKMNLFRERIGNLEFNPSNANIQAHLEDSVKRGEISPEQAQQQFTQSTAIPLDQRPTYFRNMGAKVEERYKMNTVSAGEQARLGQAERHFQQGLTQGAIPAGYRMNANKELEPIPGGPTTTPLAPKELQTREAKYPMATQAVKTVEAKSDKLIKDIETLKNHPGLDSITGTVYGRTPSVTAEGRAAQALYDSIVARGGFQELAAMRAASPTGGALGNVSNQEGQQLKDAFGTLNRTQDAADLRTQLGRVAEDIRGAKTRVREAYDMTYDYKAGAPSATPAPGGKDDPLGIR